MKKEGDWKCLKCSRNKISDQVRWKNKSTSEWQVFHTHTALSIKRNSSLSLEVYGSHSSEYYAWSLLQCKSIRCGRCHRSEGICCPHPHSWDEGSQFLRQVRTCRVTTRCYYLYCCTVHLVDSLIITQPTNALIVCHLFLNHFFKTLSLLLHVSIAYRLSSSGSTYSS